ncbi:MAG: 16S rRNA (cytidine(1402)-2'-O)-methyltransferase [Candidatus Pacebacteria bacterium]|jgi:16S rRNA (cytidine1402-2'-O)-methyltransferase|nr:16S rRNA (cytidine(1402)-2'-O)-methyltransferase [Candidatus Paceibacterota bacterium]MDP6659558.1 16S rRNA (cytidine(1402)-2'-O)-methyltransferase [Candidatus Paceibacterota bacterium]|tara:strand:- start:55848 stop:56531 length:684 start_codon:yes stop_codon:yes gene_type:complete
MATLYIIATPIGNLEDISPRALRILGEVDLVLCEDTRVTKKLLSHFNIKTPTLSYHSNSGLTKTDKILDLLESGKNLALVSDAGTPAISDPGASLVSCVREEFGDSISIISISGPSALISALSVSGLPASDFLFLGFLPHKKGRETQLKEAVDSRRTTVFYESPHRIMKTLNWLKDNLEDDRRVVVSKELTKIYEESISGSSKEVFEYFEENEDKVRGEFVIMVSGK